MKNYTIIPNSISSILDSGDTYRFTCLLFTPRKEDYTDSTFKQLGEYINSKNPESENTVKDFVKRLKAKELIGIEEVRIEDKRRNLYHIPEYRTNFRIIKKDLLELDLPVKQKGFMIQLFTLTINNTFDCNYSINKIVELIKISKPTAIKYLKELIETGFIQKTEKGFRLSSEYFSIGESKKNKEILQISESIKGCEYLTERFNKTDWDKINSPFEYWLSVIGGYTSKKAEEKVDVEIIL